MYYTEPPETYTRSSHVSAEIVSQMSSAFDINSLLSDEQKALQGIHVLLLLNALGGHRIGEKKFSRVCFRFFRSRKLTFP